MLIRKDRSRQWNEHRIWTTLGFRYRIEEKSLIKSGWFCFWLFNILIELNEVVEFGGF